MAYRTAPSIASAFFWLAHGCLAVVQESLVSCPAGNFTESPSGNQRRSDKLRNRAIIDLVLRDRKGRRKGCTQNIKHTTYATAVCSSFWRFVG